MATVTKTFSFASNAESFAGTAASNVTMAWDGTTGNPSGSLKARRTGKNLAKASSYWEWTGTWEDLGVPAGNLVTAVRVNSAQTRCTEYATAASSNIGPYELRDSAGTTLIGTLWAGRTITAADGAWVAVTAQSDVSIAHDSFATVKIRLVDQLATGSSNSAAITTYDDEVSLVITYSAPTAKSGTDSGTFSATETSAIEVIQSISSSDSGTISAATESASVADISYTFKNSFDGGTHNTTISTSNSGGTSGRAFDQVLIGGGGLQTLKFDNTQFHRGPLSIKTGGLSNGFSDFVAWNAATLGTNYETFLRGYFYFTAYPGSTTNTGIMATVDSAQATASEVRVNSDGTLAIWNGVGLQATGTYSIPLNQWVRVEIHTIHNTSSGVIDVKVWGTSPDSTGTPDDDFSASGINTKANVERARYGCTINGGHVDFWIDDVAVSNAGWLGPEVTTVTPISGTDSGTFDATETASVTLTVSSTDSGTLSATETASDLSSSTTTTDSGTFSATESDTANVGFFSTDSGSVSIAETSTVSVSVVASDSGVLSSLASGYSDSYFDNYESDESAVVVVSISSTDSGTISGSENVDAISSVLFSTDSGNVFGTDSSNSLIVVSTSDSGTLSGTESVAVAAIQVATDSGSFSVTEGSALSISISTFDSGTFTATEFTSLGDDSLGSDSGAFAAFETANILVVSSSSDAGSISASDASSPLVIVNTADSGSVSATETAVILWALSSSDDGTISIVDSGSVVSYSGYSISVWNGAAWVPGVLKVWNGSEWALAAILRWNGSAWV